MLLDDFQSVEMAGFFGQFYAAVYFCGEDLLTSSLGHSWESRSTFLIGKCGGQDERPWQDRVAEKWLDMRLKRLPGAG